MNKVLSIFLALISYQAMCQNNDSRFYELRTYYTNEGKLDNLVDRFKDHTIKIFENNGMENIGYWLPIDNKDQTLVYILAYPDKDARDKSWKGFMADPDWKAAYSASITDGNLVKKVVSKYMTPTDFSPMVKSSNKGNRVFEMRTYFPNPGKLENLMTRFRDHTLDIFESHQMENIAYWETEANDDVPATLVYILAYESENARKSAWSAFVKDPEWIKTKSDSEVNGGLVERVESIMLAPLPYSKIK